MSAQPTCPHCATSSCPCCLAGKLRQDVLDMLKLFDSVYDNPARADAAMPFGEREITHMALLALQHVADMRGELCDRHAIATIVVNTGGVDMTRQSNSRVEWHSIDGGYQVSFDKRLGASRFIILRDGAVVASGLIDGDAVLFDEMVPNEIAVAGARMHECWIKMQTRLKPLSLMEAN